MLQRINEFKAIISPEKEVVLSYFTGLAPVGQPFSINYSTAGKDLQKDQRNLIQFIRRLIQMGAIEVVVHGKGRRQHTLRVLKRPEEFLCQKQGWHNVLRRKKK